MTILDTTWALRRAAAVVGVVVGVLAGVVTGASAGDLLLAAPAHARTSSQSHVLALAEQGVAQARSAFADSTQGLWNGKRNVPIRWYDERLHQRPRYPLATVWGAVPLFESLAAVATADPTPANRTALDAFAEGSTPRAAPGPAAIVVRRGGRRHRGRGGAPILKGAESYWDPAVGGYAPYPGDRGRANVWFDDNGWWGLAFLDAYHVLGNPRFLADAQAAFTFVVRHGWDASSGGLWWNTDHTPDGQKSGEPLAAGVLLGARLAQAYAGAARASAAAGAAAAGAAAASAAAASAAAASARKADQANAAFDLQNVEKWLTWADANFADSSGLYWRTQNDPTPTPYIAGPAIEAKQLLCQLAPQPNSYCTQARQLADAAQQRFADRLNMGPQFDTIYLRWMEEYGNQTGDRRWAALATRMADRAQANATDPSTGLYERAWDGSDMAAHQADPNMLRTDAATVELFAWLAVNGP